MKNELTIEERFEWLLNNPPSNFTPTLGFTWVSTVNEFKQDLYMYCFNNPMYCGPRLRSDDEERHLLLDEYNVPRFASEEHT